MASRFSFDDMGMMAEPEQAVGIYDESRPVDILQGRGGAIGQFQFTPGSQYNLSIGGQFVGTANTEDEYRRLVQMAQQELDRSGEKAQVTFEDSRLRAGGFPQFHVEPKQTNPVIDMVLPIAASLLIPGSGALLAAAKAAGGSLASSVLQGRAVDDALLRAAISGGTAFGVGQIPGLDSLGSAKAGALASGKTGALGEAAAQQVAGGTVGGLTDDAIMTVVANKIGSGLGSAAGAVGGGLANIGADLASEASLGRLADSYDVQQPDELVVTGSRIPETGAGSALTGAAAGALPAVAAPATDAPGITVTAKPIADTALDEALAAGVGSALPQLAQNPLETDVPMSERVQDAPQEQAPEKKGGLGLLGKVSAGLTIAELISKLLGGGGGGGAPGGGGIGGGGFDQGVSFQPLNRTLRPPTFDPFTYGQTSGEFRFFGNEQPQFQVGIGGQSPAPPAQPFDPNLNIGAGGQPRNFKRGGPIRGIGGGQDDKIPAMLSDGEYVFSAQDVSDLGDGSGDEGSRRLDEMRKLIRKQAGRKNTKTIAKPQKSVSSLLRAVK